MILQINLIVSSMALSRTRICHRQRLLGSVVDVISTSFGEVRIDIDEEIIYNEHGRRSIRNQWCARVKWGSMHNVLQHHVPRFCRLILRTTPIGWTFKSVISTISCEEPNCSVTRRNESSQNDCRESRE